MTGDFRIYHFALSRPKCDAVHMGTALRLRLRLRAWQAAFRTGIIPSPFELMPAAPLGSSILPKEADPGIGGSPLSKKGGRSSARRFLACSCDRSRRPRP